MSDSSPRVRTGSATQDNVSEQARQELADSIAAAAAALKRQQAADAACAKVLDAATSDTMLAVLRAVAAVFADHSFGPEDRPLFFAVNALAQQAGFADWMMMFHEMQFLQERTPVETTASPGDCRVRRVFRSGSCGEFEPCSFDEALARALAVPLQEAEIIERVEVVSSDGTVLAAAKPSPRSIPGLRLWSWMSGPLASIHPEWLTEREKWSLETFGPGDRTKAVCAHLRKEVDEAEANPSDASEWADIILLALDGASRAGISSEAMIRAVLGKHRKNTQRRWPDWRGRSDEEPIEHDRTQDGAAAGGAS